MQLDFWGVIFRLRFRLVASHAESLEISGVVGAPGGKWHEMIYLEPPGGQGHPARLAPVAIPD